MAANNGPSLQEIQQVNQAFSRLMGGIEQEGAQLEKTHPGSKGLRDFNRSATGLFNITANRTFKLNIDVQGAVLDVLISMDALKKGGADEAINAYASRTSQLAGTFLQARIEQAVAEAGKRWDVPGLKNSFRKIINPGYFTNSASATSDTAIYGAKKSLLDI